MKIDNWPNGLGFNAKIGRLSFEIERDGQISRLRAWRVFAGEMLFAKSFPYAALGQLPDEDLAREIASDYQHNRSTWRSLERL